MAIGMFTFIFHRTLHSGISAPVDANRALLSYPVIRQPDTMLARILFFVPGMFYQVETLPLQIRNVLSWNLFVCAIEWVCYCIYLGYLTQIIYREHLLAWGWSDLFFGLGMERLLRGLLLEGR